MPKITINAVYYLESLNAGMNSLAIRPIIVTPDIVGWEDTSHGRTVKYSKIFFNEKDISTLDSEKLKIIPNHIKVISTKNEIFSLIKLTKGIFNENLKGKVPGSESLSVKSDQELQAYYLETDFYS